MDGRKGKINVALIHCANEAEPISPASVDNEPWQKRAKKAGLSQKGLARLLGVAENTVSLQLRGRWQSGTPRYVKTLIRAWELLPQAQRDVLMDGVEEDD